ncbi:MAG: glycosyltransferase family protein, partial [Candidatus Woesearchaeota archaeon]|nr:glycosyltransferase family protein [Candidatus Woesearchaeota archaeon]
SGKHILVYQTSNSNTQLKQDLANLPFNFIVYALDEQGWSKNCVWKKFSAAEDFIADLASCQGVITNGGFTLITEALHLGKPILSVPVKGQFEQILNAYYVQKLGYGLTSNVLTPELMNEFAKRLPEFKKNISKYNSEKKQNWKKTLISLIKEIS